VGTLQKDEPSPEGAKEESPGYQNELRLR
jgi:hypothetical protein